VPIYSTSFDKQVTIHKFVAFLRVVFKLEEIRKGCRGFDGRFAPYGLAYSSFELGYFGEMIAILIRSTQIREENHVTQATINLQKTLR
jgi:hypothetical protein